METAEIKNFIDILLDEFRAEDELNGFKSGAIDNAKISIKEQALIDNGFFIGGLNEDQIEHYYQTMVDTKKSI